MSKITRAVAVLAFLAMATLLWLQQSRSKRLMAQAADLRDQLEQVAVLRGENERLARQSGTANERAQADASELARLRGQVVRMKQLEQEFARLKAERDRLAQQSQASASPSPEIDPFDQEHGPGAGAKVKYAKHWGYAFINYAANHQEQFPASFEQASSFFHDGLSPAETKEAMQAADRFEILFQGSRSELEKLPPESTIILREKQPWMDKEGLWCKAYCMSDGSSTIRQSQKNDFEQWESIRLPIRKVSYPSSK